MSIDKRIFEEELPLEIRLHKIQESLDCLFTCIKGIEGREGIRSLQFHAEFSKRLCDIEDLFAGKTFKPIHDAMETHVDMFDKRVRAVEHFVKHNEEGIEKCFERIETLENHDKTRCGAIAEVSQRIIKVEKTIDELVDKIAEIANYHYREHKKPHKCPVCDGSGTLLKESEKFDFDGMLRSGLEMTKSCHACEGKGIIWG